MKKFRPGVGRGILLATALWALSQSSLAQHQHDSGAGGDAHQAGTMPMMGQEQMSAMHEHMQQMQTLMAEIHSQTDPERRHQLMREHMQHMQQGMGMMMGPMQGSQGGHQDGGGAATMPQGDSMQGMQDQMRAMQERMHMMQMMMNQMMEHMAQHSPQASGPSAN